MLAPWKISYDKTIQHIKKQRHFFTCKCPYSQSYGFSSSHVWMWESDYKRRLSAKELVLLNCDIGEDSWETLGPKEIQPVHPKRNEYWIFIGKTDAEAKTLILWPADVKSWPTGKDHWCWERLKAGGEWENRGIDGWMASPSQWTWVWASSGRWWRRGKPGVLQSMGSQRVGHKLKDWTTAMEA